MSEFKYDRFEGLSPIRRAMLILGEGAMTFGEGMTGKPFYSNYMERDRDRAKMAYEQWKQKQENDPEIIKKKMIAQMTAMSPYLSPENQGKVIDMANSLGEVKPTVRIGGDGKVSMTLSPSTKESPSATTAKELSETQNFIQQFGRAYDEQLKMFPEIGETGYVGWATRKGGKIANYFDQLPETKAFQVEKLPLANKMARTIEGGRVTDKDREVYANALADSLEHPTETNIRLVSNSLSKLYQKGGDIAQHLAEFNSSNIDIFSKVVASVLKDNPKLKEEVLRRTYLLNPDRFEVVE